MDAQNYARLSVSRLQYFLIQLKRVKEIFTALYCINNTELEGSASLYRKLENPSNF